MYEDLDDPDSWFWTNVAGFFSGDEKMKVAIERFDEAFWKSFVAHHRMAVADWIDAAQEAGWPLSEDSLEDLAVVAIEKGFVVYRDTLGAPGTLSEEELAGGWTKCRHALSERFGEDWWYEVALET